MLKKHFDFPKENSYPKDYHYIRYYTSSNPIVKYAFVERLKRTIDLSYQDLLRADTVVEIGPGPGFLFLEFAKYTNHIIGLDIDHRNMNPIQVMTSKYDIDHKVFLLEADVHNLPFNDASLELIYCLSVLEHVKPEKAIQEISRVLKPRGVLIAGLPIDTFLSEIGRAFFLTFIPDASDKNEEGYEARHKTPKENLYSSVKHVLRKYFNISHGVRVPHNSFPNLLSLYEILRCIKRK